MQADAEHEEDHAQLGELADRLRIAHEAGREGADRDAGQQVADDGGQPDATGDEAAKECGDQRHGNLDQQGQLMHSDSKGADATASVGFPVGSQCHQMRL